MLNAMWQTGSVLGVALFGALLGRAQDFLAGARWTLAIAAPPTASNAAAIIILCGTSFRRPRSRENSSMVRSPAE